MFCGFAVKGKVLLYILSVLIIVKLSNSNRNNCIDILIEEILYNYNYDLEDAFDNPCYCGSKNCIGYMVGEEYWPKLRKQIAKREKKIRSKRLG